MRLARTLLHGVLESVRIGLALLIYAIVGGAVGFLIYAIIMM